MSTAADRRLASRNERDTASHRDQSSFRFGKLDRSCYHSHMSRPLATTSAAADARRFAAGPLRARVGQPTEIAVTATAWLTIAAALAAGLYAAATGGRFAAGVVLAALALPALGWLGLRLRWMLTRVACDEERLELDLFGRRTTVSWGAVTGLLGEGSLPIGRGRLRLELSADILRLEIAGRTRGLLVPLPSGSEPELREAIYAQLAPRCSAEPDLDAPRWFSGAAQRFQVRGDAIVIEERGQTRRVPTMQVARAFVEQAAARSDLHLELRDGERIVLWCGHAGYALRCACRRFLPCDANRLPEDLRELRSQRDRELRRRRLALALSGVGLVGAAAACWLPPRPRAIALTLGALSFSLPLISAWRAAHSSRALARRADRWVANRR